MDGKLAKPRVSAIGKNLKKSLVSLAQSPHRLAHLGALFESDWPLPALTRAVWQRSGGWWNSTLVDTLVCMHGGSKMAARQFSVRLPNGWSLGDEVTRRDIEVLRRWHVDVAQHGTAPWQVDSQDLVRIDFVLCRAYSEDRMAG